MTVLYFLTLIGPWWGLVAFVALVLQILFSLNTYGSEPTAGRVLTISIFWPIVLILFLAYHTGLLFKDIFTGKVF